jgi:TPR repeat protein
MEGRGTKVDESEGLSWFRKSAALDGFEGQYNLGLCFARGAGGVQRNPELAVRSQPKP